MRLTWEYVLQYLIARMLGMRLRWERVKPFSVRRELLGKLMSGELPLV